MKLPNTSRQTNKGNTSMPLNDRIYSEEKLLKKELPIRGHSLWNRSREIQNQEFKKYERFFPEEILGAV